jgi:hypothetical protein
VASACGARRVRCARRVDSRLSVAAVTLAAMVVDLRFGGIDPHAARPRRAMAPMPREDSSVAYQPPTAYRRTPEEMVDQTLSWARPDRGFFAAGACHILAWAFLETAAGQGFRPLGLRRVGEPYAFHVIADNGVLAFDYAGWTARGELLAVIRGAIGEERPGTAVQEIELPADLAEFCALQHHRLPHQFAGEVRARARAYLRWLDPTLGD